MRQLYFPFLTPEDVSSLERKEMQDNYSAELREYKEAGWVLYDSLIGVVVYRGGRSFPRYQIQGLRKLKRNGPQSPLNGQQLELLEALRFWWLEKCDWIDGHEIGAGEKSTGLHKLYGELRGFPRIL